VVFEYTISSGKGPFGNEGRIIETAYGDQDAAAGWDDLRLGDTKNTKKSTETLLGASKEVCLQVNADRTKCTSRHRSAGQNLYGQLDGVCLRSQRRYLDGRRLKGKV
jgi:hypothetical protein